MIERVHTYLYLTTRDERRFTKVRVIRLFQRSQNTLWILEKKPAVGTQRTRYESRKRRALYTHTAHTIRSGRTGPVVRSTDTSTSGLVATDRIVLSCASCTRTTRSATPGRPTVGCSAIRASLGRTCPGRRARLVLTTGGPCPRLA